MATRSEWQGQKLEHQSGQSPSTSLQCPTSLQYPRSQDFIAVFFIRAQKTRAKRDLAITQFNFISEKKKKAILIE